MSRRSTVCLLTCLVFLLTAPAALAQVNIKVSATIEQSQLESSGRFNIKLKFVVDEVPKDPYRVRCAIYSGAKLVFTRDHRAPSRPSSWKKGEAVEYDLPSLFPLNSVSEALAPALDIYIGFLNVPDNEKILPAGKGTKTMDGMRFVGTIRTPSIPETMSDEEVDAAIADAEKLNEEKKYVQSWDRLEFAMRRSSSYPQKRKLQKVLEKIGKFAPRKISRLEQYVVASRIRAEKVRWLRDVAGKMHDARQLHGALKILEEVGGMLEENNREAEIGAVAEAKRVTQSAKSIKRRMVQMAVKKDKDVLDKLEENPLWKARKNLLEFATNLEKRGHVGAAWEALRRAKDDIDEDVIDEALKRREELEKKIIATEPPDAKEQYKRVDDEKNNPAFGRLVSMPTHKFIFIGPKILIEGLIRNKQATLRFDLAYIYQTDLFGRNPSAGGSRITVFFKELWDFGGGQAGGNRIDIGRANPNKTNQRVDNGLMYHELVHCIYHMGGYGGFNEGIANFGATFTFSALGQSGGEMFSFRNNLRAFKEDYADRDMDFWRIQKYGPSAGFFLHFITKYGKKDGRYHWELYRKFFNGYNRRPLRDGRPMNAIRAIAYYLAKSFGDEVYADLKKFRFPITDTDKEAIPEEVDQGDYKFPKWGLTGEGFKRFPNSPVNRDVLYRTLTYNRMRPAPQVISFCKKRLGIIYDWKVCGPFLATSKRSYHEVFPPEQGEIDFEKRYVGDKHTAIWRTPSTTDATKYVSIAKDGWVTMKYPYPEHTSSYCYARLTSPEARKGRLWLRTNDHLTVWLNGKFLVKMKHLGAPGSWSVPWRLNRVTDEINFPLDLEQGINLLVIKVTNKDKDAGHVAAVTDPNGQVMADLKVDAIPPSDDSTDRKAPKPKWKKGFILKERALRSLKTAVGKFSVKLRGNKARALVGTDTRKRVFWRKYDVRPGVPKDSPSNLAWLPSKVTKGLTDFRLGMELLMDRPRLPKMTLTWDGEGKKDGLSGWTLVFAPAKKNKGFHVRLERYDNLYFKSDQVTIKPKDLKDSYTLLVQRVDGKMLIKLDDHELFRNVHVPKLRIEGADHIGFATWGPQVGIQSLTFQRTSSKKKR